MSGWPLLLQLHHQHRIHVAAGIANVVDRGAGHGTIQRQSEELRGIVVVSQPL